MDTLVDPIELPLEKCSPLAAAKSSARVPVAPPSVPAPPDTSLDVDVDWHGTTPGSLAHPGVSIESWRRARGWSTED
jgi:hypothetical protein